MEARAEVPERRLSPVMREGERVTPLELFFDLVFVLALTQCTALMVANPTWEGVAQGLMALALLWWTWTGYAWLTSVVDPEEGAVRLVLVASMSALLIAALAVPDAFGDEALEFALAYAVVRAAHITLFVLASREAPLLRHSVAGLALSTGAGVALLIAGALVGGTGQAVLWGLALLIDVGGPYFFGAEGWQLIPAHFAERHGLVMIVALGESVVALGVGADIGLSLSVTATAVLGIVLVFELWWIYFDVVAIANVWRLVRAPEGASATPWPATSTPTCTSCWSPGSSSPPSASTRLWRTPRTRCTPYPRSRSSAAWRSTSWATSRCASAAPTPSASDAW